MGALPDDARLILIPGLAADREVFRPQLDAFGDSIHVPLWLQPHKRETLTDYAGRWAGMLAGHLQPVEPDRPLFLGGLSFGAMVAYEMAATLRSRGLFLIGGCRSAASLAWWAWPAERVSAVLPRVTLPWVIPAVARMIAAAEQLDADQRRMFVGIARRADAHLARWSTWAAVHGREPATTPPAPSTRSTASWTRSCRSRTCRPTWSSAAAAT
jgi:pimeloyl-ACP methyl ester carboxylesterase